MTEKEKWFIVCMYEKPALFLKKYLVPPSMLFLCEEEGKGDELNLGFWLNASVTWALSPLLSVNGLREEDPDPVSVVADVSGHVF